MAKEILKCVSCGEYTLQEKHCDKKTIQIKPARYSPEDRLGKYRRKLKSKVF